MTSKPEARAARSAEDQRNVAVGSLSNSQAQRRSSSGSNDGNKIGEGGVRTKRKGNIGAQAKSNVFM